MKNYKNIGLSSKLRKAESIADKPRPWKSEFEQDAQVEKGPYANPTEINKGRFDITGGGTLTVKDATGGTTLLTFDPTSGSATLRGDFVHTGDYNLTGDMDITGALTVGGTTITGAYSKGEMGYKVSMGGRQWTTSASFVDIPGSLFRLDGDSFVLSSIYFEVCGCVEVAGGTASYKVYNVTDGTSLADGTILGTAVSSEGDSWNTGFITRSGTLALPSGVKTYKLQYKLNETGGEGTSTQLMNARIIIVNA